MPRFQAMPGIVGLVRAVLRGLCRWGRPLFAFQVCFSGLAAAVLVPFGTWGLAAALRGTGRDAVIGGELAGFVLSLPGTVWLSTAAVLAVLLYALPHAGMILVVAAAAQGRRRPVMTGVWQLIRRLPLLFRLIVVQLGAHLLLAVPFVLAMAGLHAALLEGYDGYYLRTSRPPVYWAFLGASAPMALGLAIASALLYLRWALALPVLLLERCGVFAALGRSAELTSGRRSRLAVALLGGAVVAMGLPALLTLAFDALGSILLEPLPEHVAMLGPVMTGFLAAYLLCGFLAAFFGVGVNSLLVYTLYRQAVGTDVPLAGEPPPRRAGVLAWGAELALLGAAVWQAGLAWQSFELEDEVTITAHRGSSALAPENTLAAVDRAIADGADYVEIDVTLTADGTVVLLHDRDLRRVAGLPRPVWELADEQVRGLDVGSWFGPEFTDERVPTLREVVRRTYGKARLYIEIKHHPVPPRLTVAVLEVLHEEGALEGTVIASMSRTVVRELARLAPEVSVALSTNLILGWLDPVDLDALGLRHDRIGRTEVALARRHGYELHAWTVNDRATMSRMIDLGVDNIITDRPDELAELLRERAGLSERERLLLKVRSWLRS